MIHHFELEKITYINNYQTQQIMTNKFFSFYLGQLIQLQGVDWRSHQNKKVFDELKNGRHT